MVESVEVDLWLVQLERLEAVEGFRYRVEAESLVGQRGRQTPVGTPRDTPARNRGQIRQLTGHRSLTMLEKTVRQTH